MAKPIQCPNCGASQSQKIGENEFKCDFCNTSFHFENKSFSQDILNALKNVNSYRVNTHVPGIKTLRFLPIMIFMLVAGISLSIFFTVKNSVDTAIQNANNPAAKSDDYWGTESVNKFYVFQGKKSTLIWELINQSSKGLDSAKYTIRIIDPKKNKVVYNEKFMSMTWNESFNFQNYLNEMISFHDKVYFLSDDNGINIYDLNTGKLKLNSDQFAQQFNELKAGIVSSKWQWYRSTIELVTKDGFKFYYLPRWEKLISKEQYEDYSSTRKDKNAFVLSEGDRPQLYFVNAKMDTLRSDYSISDYYFKQALKGDFRHSDIKKLTPYSEDKVFFNSKIVFRNSNTVLLIYTENLDKKSKAFMAYFSFENEIKLNWEKSLNELSGLENLLKDDIYFQENHTSKEVVIWYWVANKMAISLDLNTGNLNWSFAIK